MISEASRPYIDASVPVLRQHGVTITRLFYSNMLGAHPELTRIFNMGNQASGTQQQSLASAVFAYAEFAPPSTEPATPRMPQPPLPLLEFERKVVEAALDRIPSPGLARVVFESTTLPVEPASTR